jgi:hypothetical protein
MVVSSSLVISSKVKSVLKAGAAPALHEHAQFQVGVALLGNEVGHLGRRAVGEQNGGGHFSLDVFGYGTHGWLR